MSFSEAILPTTPVRQNVMPLHAMPNTAVSESKIVPVYAPLVDALRRLAARQMRLWRNAVTAREERSPDLPARDARNRFPVPRDELEDRNAARLSRLIQGLEREGVILGDFVSSSESRGR